MLRSLPAAVAVAVVLRVLPSNASVTPNPDLLGMVLDVGQAKSVVLDHTKAIAYVASVQFGLATVDVSSHIAPVVIGAANPSFYAEHVAVSGAVAMLMGGTQGVQFVDVSNPASPALLGACGLLSER